MSKRHRETAPGTVQTGWTETMLICRKCSRKLDGGFGADGEQTLRQALRHTLRRTGRRGAVGLLDAGCFGICPKRAVVVAHSNRPGELQVVPRGTPPERVLTPLRQAGEAVAVGRLLPQD